MRANLLEKEKHTPEVPRSTVTDVDRPFRNCEDDMAAEFDVQTEQ